MDDDDEDYEAVQASSVLPYKKQRKTDSSQLDMANIVVDDMKKSMVTLGSSLKEAMSGGHNEE